MTNLGIKIGMLVIGAASAATIAAPAAIAATGGDVEVKKPVYVEYRDSSTWGTIRSTDIGVVNANPGKLSEADVRVGFVATPTIPDPSAPGGHTLFPQG